MKLSKLMLSSAAVAAALMITTPVMRAQATATATAPAKKATKAAPPTDAEISDASAKGMVWVNKNTKVYHKRGTAMYGKTKNGAFMSEADAEKAGYKAAQESKAKKAKAAAASATTK